LAALLLVAMVLIVNFHVIMRYFFNSTPAWTEELSLLLMIWFCFIAMMIGVKLKAHIAIEMFMDKLPRKAQYVVNLIDKFAVLAFSWMTGWYIIPYIRRLAGNKLPATGLSVAVQYVIVVIAGLMMVAVIIDQIITQLKGEEK
jgi:TRAP-type C4-dicarboxylate transport system permease small subunit